MPKKSIYNIYAENMHRRNSWSSYLLREELVYCIILMTSCCSVLEGCRNSLFDLFMRQWIRQFHVVLHVRWLL